MSNVLSLRRPTLCNSPQANGFEIHSGYCVKGIWAEKVLLTNGAAVAEHGYHHAINKGAYAVVGAWLDYTSGTFDDFDARGGAEGYSKGGSE